MSDIFKSTTPVLKIKIAAKDAEALDVWLERAIGLRDSITNGSTALRAYEKKVEKLSAEIARLEPRADEDDAAARLPALQTQLAAVQRKMEGIMQDDDHKNSIQLVLSELRPLLTKAMSPILAAEAERMAAPLLPYFRNRAGALYVVQQSDWMKFLGAIYLSEWRHGARLEPAIQVVEAALRCELPYPYAANPTSES